MKYSIFYIAIFIVALQACSPAGGNKRGHEFMPDMAHSTAYEANLYDYYYYNTWGSEEEYKKFANPRKPVNGTVPRGMTSVSYGASMNDRVEALEKFDGSANQTQLAIPANGAAPYYYGNSDAERKRAASEIIDNPFPITDAGMARAKELYVIYCGICHGDKGDGNGYLVREADPTKGDFVGGVYPAAPANFLKAEFIDTTNGMYYHSIMHGKNVMGSYADKLSFEERWQVIHYIRSLQAKELKLQYNENANTLNSVEIPFSMMKKMTHDEDNSEDHGEALPDGDEEGHHGEEDADHSHEGGHQ